MSKSSTMWAIFRREFRSYFDSPVAYVFLTAFLVLAGFLTFGVAMFYERRQADLVPFFLWHPWIYLLLVPAATMGLWSDERRNGTVELLLTLPMTIWDVLVGKFLAAWSFIGVALVLTFPVVATAAYLGSPDWGVVFCGYLGSLFLAGAATAIGVFGSTLSRSSVVGFVVALALVFTLLLFGFDPVTSALAGWGVPMGLVDGIGACSLLTHYEAMQRGVLDGADLAYYIGMMVFFLVAAKMVTDGRRGASKGVVGLAAVGAIVVAVVAILSQLSLRADLTEEHLYTLTKGSKAVLGKLEQEVVLKYYVSSSAAEMPLGLKAYARQVENLLQEYERAGDGQIVLEKYDPVPDSDAEEWAQRYGIEPQATQAYGSPIYFGVVAVCGEREETLGVLSPRTEATLEYDLTRLVTRVAWPERPVVGIMSSLEGILGAPANPMMMQMGQRPPRGWAVFEELSKDYDVCSIATDVDAIDPTVTTLVLVHAKELSSQTLYAIDQFVLRGGRLIACVDPMSVKDLMASRKGANPMMGMSAGLTPSTLGPLFEAWGITFDTNAIACDTASSTRLNNGQGGVEDNPAFLSIGPETMDEQDLLVSGLSQVMFPFAGSFTFDSAKTGLRFAPVISTSTDHASSVDRMGAINGLSGMRQQLVPDGQARVLAARLSGTFQTAFPQGPDGTNAVENALSEGTGSVLLFGDSDFLADDFSVQVLSTPFGAMLQPMNSNLSLFSNVMEQFAGREELIGIRTRGLSDRPFKRVDALEAKAIEKWQQKETEIQEALQETQARLAELQRQKSKGERAILSSEQQQEIVRFRKRQSEMRRQLKTVRRELTSEIDALGLRLKALNIALIPLFVVAFGVVRAIRRRLATER